MSRFLTNRQLSQHLVGLWTTDCSPTNELLSRVLPAGLLQYLDSEDKVTIVMIVMMMMMMIIVVMMMIDDDEGADGRGYR